MRRHLETILSDSTEKKPVTRTPWTTGKEIEFIKKLKGKALSGYIIGSMKRGNWDGMNKDVVMAFAINRLQSTSEGDTDH